VRLAASLIPVLTSEPKARSSTPGHNLLARAERNFRPLRITKVGDNAGFLTGYYEPIIDGTGIFKVR
jgi:hypothetical protein